jgi:vitamin B12 transporter
MTLLAEQPPPIVITARALPPGTGERSQSVVTLTAEELRRAPSQSLDQIIRSVPGVQLFRRSDARSANPTSQGVTLRGLGGNAAGRALVLLDGVPQADPFGGWVNWPALDPSLLSGVRITRGGGSVLFGPGALAGTIELAGRSEAGLAASLDANHGGAAETRLFAGTGGVQLSGWGGTDRGFVPVVAEDRGAADRRAPFRFGGLRLSGETGSWRAGAMLFADRRSRGLAFTDIESEGADLFLSWRKDRRASLLAYHQERGFRTDFANATADRSSVSRSLIQSVPARASGWSAEVRPAGLPFELRLGSDGRLASGRSEEQASFVGAAPTRGRRAEGRQATAGLFADLASTLGRMEVSGGARLDRWWLRRLSLEERALADGRLLLSERAPGRSGWQPTARAGLRLPLGERLSFRAAAYLGWRLPTLNELVRPFRVGRDAVAANPLLKPERMRGLETGADWSAGPVSASVTLFANRLQSPIANVTRGSGPGVFPGVGFVAGSYRRRENLEAIDSKGFEADLRWRRGEWHAAAALSLLSARVRGEGPLDGRKPAQVAPLSAFAEAGWRQLSLQLRHVGPQAEDDLGTLRLPAAMTLDASGTFPLSRGVELRLRAENLLGARVLAATSAEGIDERATPRRLWAGLTLRR